MAKKLEIGMPVTIDGVKLIPVIGMSVDTWTSKTGAYTFGTRQPEYIVTVSGQTTRAFDIHGEEISFDQLLTQFPDLDITSFL